MCEKERPKIFQRERKYPVGSKEWLEYERKWALDKADVYNSREGDLYLKDGIDCPKCKNKGFIQVVPEGQIDPILKQCDCWKKRKIVMNARHSGLGNLLGKKLEDYRVEEEWQCGCKAKAIEYLRNPEGWFVMLGQPGAGKTLLCGIVANQLLREGRLVHLKSWPELVRESSVEWFKEKEVLQQWKEAEVLFIDDFLKTGTDARSLQIAYEILNYRYANDLLTIICGERRLSEMYKIDEALASRIKEKSGQYLIDLGNAKERNQR